MAASETEREDSAELESESDNNDPEELSSDNPWPYLKSMFQFDRVKDTNVDVDKRTYMFKCLLCLPKNNYLSAFHNPPSNLKKHVDAS